MTVSALNRVVAGSLLRSFPLVRVAGEVCNFTRAASGHWYFGLKDPAAQVRCVMFRGRNALVGRPPRDGEAVEVLAQVTLYEPRGEFQLGVESLQRSGVGRLYEEFVRLRDRLAAEGLFDQDVKRPLPRFPRNVAVVTSLQAAALRDVLVALQRRTPYLRVIVHAVPVQGDGAGARIAAALAAASARCETDVILLVRGGGSLEDLWAFNEEVVARAIRAATVPVVTGVGHESDITIADLAADLRAPTPTAAAELVAPAQRELAEYLQAAVQLLARRARASMERQQQRLDYAQRATALPDVWLRAASVRRLRDPRRTEAAERAERLRRAAGQCMAAHRTKLQQLVQALGHLDPRRVLERGYAIVFDERRRAVTDARAIAAGARLEVQLARGELSVDVRASHVRASDEGTSPHD